MFQLNIVDLGIAIPLQPLEPTSTTADESGDFLVFTLDQTTISACSCGAVISSGSFQGFCFRFAENFRQSAMDWKPVRTGSNVILNACRVPSGQYSMHSLAKHLTPSKSPKWFLNVQWDMKGIDININSSIGKHFSQLSRTITSTQLMESTPKSDSCKEPSVHGGATSHPHHPGDNTTNVDDNHNEDVEKRKRLEFEYSNFGQKIDSLRRSNVPFDVLKAEEDRFKSLERELLQAIKSEIQQRMKKQSNKVRLLEFLSLGVFFSTPSGSLVFPSGNSIDGWFLRLLLTSSPLFQLILLEPSLKSFRVHSREIEIEPLLHRPAFLITVELNRTISPPSLEMQSKSND